MGDCTTVNLQPSCLHNPLPARVNIFNGHQRGVEEEDEDLSDNEGDDDEWAEDENDSLHH